ncbi:OprD family outer membrane porin [Motilimonas eburnea]|uniref:OprD family outer membrane porin n=1 Tax=Motilimonas eburnea TaxID=1737488 RepID=UPI001E48627F|nr:OprD family outer membrane porin [Motilimonas eburnea]MCE2571031.1 OprD family porin [Motilimonas eburnea]
MKKGSNFFRLNSVGAAVLAAVAGLSMANAPEAQANGFMEDSSLTGGLYLWDRNRDRRSGPEDGADYETNLAHTTINANLDFTSGYANDIIGLDFGVFFAGDLRNDGLTGHEMSFFPGGTPWGGTDWGSKDEAGVSVYKAAVKVKGGPAWAKAGYFQPSGPGVMGVNWSFMPGTYLGGEAGFSINGFDFAAAVATEYKAPWFKDTYEFRMNDGTTKVDYLYSIGGRYTFDFGTSVELAYGESDDYLRNGHLKLKHDMAVRQKDSLYMTYQLYMMSDINSHNNANENFDGTAYQHYIGARYNTGPYTVRAEGLYTKAPQSETYHQGQFAYRLTSAYGGSNGAYEPWWDARSDWNHNEEKAVFIGVWRDLADLGAAGWSTGVSYAYGWGGESIEAPTDELKENAWNLDIAYTVQDGSFKGTTAKLHYTKYENESDQPSWGAYKNAFQDEQDLKFMIIMPFSL